MKNNLNFYKNILNSGFLIKGNRSNSKKNNKLKILDLYMFNISIKQFIRIINFLILKKKSLIYAYLENNFLKNIFYKLVLKNIECLNMKSTVYLPRLYKSSINKAFIGFTNSTENCKNIEKLFKNNFFLLSFISENIKKNTTGIYKINANTKNFKHLAFFLSLINNIIQK